MQSPRKLNMREKKVSFKIKVLIPILAVLILSILVISFISYRMLDSFVRTKTNATMEIFADNILTQIRHLNIILNTTKQTLNEKHIAIAKTVVDMLDHIPGEISSQKLQQIAEPLDIIELNIANSNGIIIASNAPKYIGFDYKLYEPTKKYMKLADGTITELSEEPRASAYKGDVGDINHYTGIARKNGGFVQIGFNASVIGKLQEEINIYKTIKETKIGQNGFGMVLSDTSNISGEDWYKTVSSGNGFAWLNIDGKQYYAGYKNENGNTVVALVPEQDFHQERNRLLLNSAIFLLIAVVIITVVIYLTMNLFTNIPISYKRQASMKHKFFFFSAVLFLFIFIPGSAVFIILMNKIHYDNAGQKLTQTVEMERLKLEAAMNSEIAIALKMAESPLIQRFFLNPADGELQKIALEEIDGYRKAFTGKNVFWIGDIDKKYYFNNEYVYTLNPSDESSWWYNSIMKNPDSYSMTVNFDVGIQKNMLWIDAPVFDNNKKPIGILGTGVNLLDFLNAISYIDSRTEDELYIFNSAGELIKAKDFDLVEKKANITQVLNQTGEEILSRTKKMKIGEIEYFKTKLNRQIIAVTSIPISSVPALNWYITAIRPVTITGFLHSGMTVLFGIMMAVIFSAFVFFNIFITVMLEPLNRMVKTIKQTFADWDMDSQKGGHHKDEMGTLDEFFHLTIIDQLTGIYNRRYFDGSLKKIIKLHSRTGSCLSVLMIDVDYFKKYNDSYGHDAGDNCLRAVAEALSQCVIRDEDFVARYGGEEFVVVLPNTDKNGAQVIAEKMLEKIREEKIPHKASDVADYVTISIGGATGIIKHSQNPQDYIKVADKALYESKKNGRNRYTFEEHGSKGTYLP